MDYKEIWNERYNEVEERLGRELTLEETRQNVDLYVKDKLLSYADHLRDEAKYE